jgi:hypothetical protein
MTSEKMYPCPCCGYLVFGEPPGSYDICPICGWEDDLSQLRFPEVGGANVPLIQAQQNYKAFGASEARRSELGRQPGADDYRDPEWRPVDLARDNAERPVSGIDYGNSYPPDSETLYYWRKAYWRLRTTNIG